jgi:hypothetical protein
MCTLNHLVFNEQSPTAAAQPTSGRDRILRSA